MERTISFKLLARLTPVSITTDALTMGDLVTVIKSNEELSNLISTEPKFINEDGVNKKSVNVLVDAATGAEYTFDKPNSTLPEGEVLFFVTPVTSKFGVNDEIIELLESIEDNYQNTGNALYEISNALFTELERIKNMLYEINEKLSSNGYKGENKTNLISDEEKERLEKLNQKAQELQSLLNKRFNE